MRSLGWSFGRKDDVPSDRLDRDWMARVDNRFMLDTNWCRVIFIDTQSFLGIVSQ